MPSTISKNGSDEFGELQSIRNQYQTIHHLEDKFSLPHSEDISGYLTEGVNYIDIQAINSRITCDLLVALRVNNDFERVFDITSNPWSPPNNPPKLSASGIEWEFDTGTNSSRANDDLPKYLTNNGNQAYRLCERLRLQFNLDSNQIPILLRNDSALKEWLRSRIERDNMP
jgi:hypothetical protein